MHRSSHLTVAAATIVLFASLPSRTSANWPMARHDAKRSGAATGKSDMKKPVPYFRFYLGGAISTPQLAQTDVDGDGRSDLLLTNGGRIVAKRYDDSAIWQSKPYGIDSIIAVNDLDGDGKLDVVASSTSKVLIFALATGRLEWEEPDGEHGTLGRTLVTDFNGDGKADVLTVECSCCGVTHGQTGYLRSFAAGFAKPKLLFTLPALGCGSNLSATSVDMDGDGNKELLLGMFDHLELYRGDNGMLLAKSATLGPWISVSQCFAKNLDGTPGDELACLLNASDTPGVDQRKIYVVTYDETLALKMSWKSTIAPDADGDVALVDPIADLDGDGTPELVVSGYDPMASSWKTRILDAATGTDLVPPLSGQQFVGTAAMESRQQRILLTTARNSLFGWAFTRKPAAQLAPRWQVADRAVITTLHPQRLAEGGFAQDILHRDLDGDGREELILRASQGKPTLYALSAAGGTPQDLGMAMLTSGTKLLNAWALLTNDRNGAAFAIAQSDGILVLFDAYLRPITTGGEFPQKLTQHIGGYYAHGAWRELRRAPRSIAFNTGEPDSIVVSDSRDALLRLDAHAASWALPPTVVWEKLDHAAPTLVPGLDGAAAGIACLKQSNQDGAIAVLRANGTEIWSKPIERFPINDVVPGKLNADSTPDLVVEWGDPSDVVLRMRAFSGIDGTKLWDATPVSPGAGRQPAGLSIGTWNSDGSQDVYTQGPGTRVLSGADGKQLTSGGAGDAYFMPTLVDTNGDGSDEVLLHGGFSPVRLYDHALSTPLFTSAQDDRPYPYGAVAACPAGLLFIEGSLAFPARVKRTVLSGASLGQFTTQVLANGQSYANETAAKNAGAYLGQLTSASVHQNLTGQGRPTVLLGSSDGYLYALNPCDGSLDFVVPFETAVGEATFADTDGDGRDEILVTTADGYLYGLKNENITAPDAVSDIDPDAPWPGDIEQIHTRDRLAARWTAVAGAIGYEVAAVTSTGQALSAWKNVGTQTETTISGLTLDIGARYFFAVRALSAAGPSVDALSNGVTVRPKNVDAGTSTKEMEGEIERAGCSCRSTAAGDRHAALGAMAVMLIIALRRRKRAY